MWEPEGGQCKAYVDGWIEEYHAEAPSLSMYLGGIKSLRTNGGASPWCPANIRPCRASRSNRVLSERSLFRTRILHQLSSCHYFILEIHWLDMSIQALRRQVAEAESQLADLRRQLHQAEQSVKDFCANDDTLPTPERSFFPASPSSPPISHPNHGRPLDLEEYKRYGRQMIVPSLGLEGQTLR